MTETPSHLHFQAPDIAQLAPLFPGYEIEGLIATGGMGAVYRAIQRSLDRTVAIKILPKEFSADQAFCAGFEAEAKAMARLNHPNLIGVYDFGAVNGTLYIIMEYVPGQSLFHAAHGVAIDSTEVIKLVTAICDGLSHAHENGILHRDIKPANILLDLNAQPKIGDFGLARPDDLQIQEGEEIFGTPHYTAPEVVNAPYSVDNRADIFSVGVILHELLTGKLPAEDHRSASVIIHCDPRFDSIIRRATHPDPAGRYTSAAEIAKELKTITSTGARDRQAQRPGTPVSRRPRVVAPVKRKSSSSQGILILLGILGVAALAYHFLYKPTGRQAPSQTVAPAPQPESQPPTPPEPQPEPPPVPETPATATLIPAPTVPAAPDEPTPTSTATPKSAFDVPAFLERAHDVMQTKVASRIAMHDQALLANLSDFDRSLRMTSRSSSKKKSADKVGANLDALLQECRQNNNKLPAELPPELAEIPDAVDLHKKYYAKQQAIDEEVIQSLAQQTPTYILGIEKQIERLRASNDSPAIDLLEEEISKSRTEQTYFPYLMMGIETTDDASAPP